MGRRKKKIDPAASEIDPAASADAELPGLDLDARDAEAMTDAMTPAIDSPPEPQASAPTVPAGIECPRCGCRHLPVYYTRARGKTIVRVRHCRHCGRRVVTRETA